MTDYKKYINALKKCAKEHENDGTLTGHIIVSDLCNDAANLLEAIEQQTCDAVSKFISRQVSLLEEKMSSATSEGRWVEEGKYQCAIENLELVDEYIKAHPQEKTGHWIHKLEDWNKWTCSECGFSKRTDVHVRLGFKFCPNCGCRMINRKE